MYDDYIRTHLKNSDLRHWFSAPIEVRIQRSKSVSGAIQDWIRNDGDEFVMGANPKGQIVWRGPKLYSYGTHHLLAEMHPLGVISVNPERPSRTTARHADLVFWAVDRSSDWTAVWSRGDD